MKQILSLSPVFRLFSSLVGTPQAHRRFVREAVQPRKGDRVLEFGCGCGDLVEQFNECDYVGIDPSENYIATAKRRFGLDGQFICSTIEKASLATKSFNKVVSYGVMHHLSDGELHSALSRLAELSTDGGRWFSIDPVILPRQRKLVRTLINNDRGEYVRTPEQYLSLLSPYYTELKIKIIKDWLNIPYDLILLEGTRP